MLQYYGYLPCKFWTQPGSLASRYINGGPFGAYININIFLCLGLILFKQRIHIKIIIFGFFFLFVSALILSNSRISWLVFAFLLIIALFLFMSLTSAKTKGFAPIVIFAIIIFSACWYFGPKIWHRVIIAQTTQFQSLLQRFDVWKGTLKIILAYPFGSGLGTFQYIYPVFRTHSDRFVVDFAHSDALQLASESGIAALTLFGWFLVRVFSAVIRSLKDLQNRNKYLVLGVAFAVLSFVLQGFIDFPIRVPANAVLFFVCLGLLTSLGKRQHKIIFSRLSSILLFLFVVVCVFIFSCIFFANKYYTCAERNFKSLRWSEAFSNYSKTIKLMPIKAENYFGRGQIYFSRAKAVFGEKRLKNDRFAEFDFKKAVKLNPYYSYAYLNLASLYVDEEKQKEALAAFNKAIETNPTVGAFYYPYADYCLEHGFLGEALETYRKSLSLFINDDGSFSNRYGTIQGLFSKIYDHTSDYSQLKLVIPDKANIRLEFAYFLEQKNLFPESCSEYNDILTNYPDNKIAKAAIERLKVKCQK
ncbi:MAG: O-antigen ligase family protein [Candidatus Omnitrophica bacterium]|nr:O-antigen ligase family protein [Candidatus Omnitrophota bacterium]MBU1870160.1 O-antigen ligase family protein [Candidatus Omnitrophota bacterium]